MGGNGSRIAVYRKTWRRFGKLYYVLMMLDLCGEDMLYYERELVARMPMWLGKGWLKRQLKEGK